MAKKDTLSLDRFYGGGEPRRKTGMAAWLDALEIDVPTRFPTELSQARNMGASVSAGAKSAGVHVTTRYIDDVLYVCRLADENGS